MDSHSRPRRWWHYALWLLLIMLLLLVVVGIWVWLTINDRAKLELTSQLANLELGQPNVEEVRTSTHGLVAENVKFPADPKTGRPEIQIDRLTINQPLSKLIAGETDFESIELDGANVRLPLSQLTQPADAIVFDFNSLKLPAKKIDLKNASFILFDPDRNDIVIDGINLSISQDADAIEVTGEVLNLLGNRWDVAGKLGTNRELSDDKQSSQFTLSSKKMKLENDDWQSLPLLPEGLEKWVQANGQAAVEMELSLNEDSTIDIRGMAELERIRLKLPAFDLPIEVSNGQLRFVNNKIDFDNLVASTDGTDRLTASGSMNVDQFPFVIQFESSFDDFSTDSLRKLVDSLPDILSGRADGTATGIVEISADSSVRLKLDSAATSTAASYGELETKQAEIATKIERLTFDADQQFVAIDGAVGVRADLHLQSVKRLMNTFELDSFDRQLELSGNFSGSAEITIPLKTAEQITTWELQFHGDLPTASVGGQPLRMVTVCGGLEDDELVFDSVRGFPVLDLPTGEAIEMAQQDAVIEAKIRWPIVSDDHSVEHSANQATIILDGQHVPPEWFANFMARQMTNAEMHLPLEIGSLVDEFNGAIDLGARLELSVVRPDDLKRWILAAKIDDSALNWNELSIRNLAAEVKMNEGVLEITNLAGKTDAGGEIAASGAIDLFDVQQSKLTIFVNEMPSDWLSRLVTKYITGGGVPQRQLWLQQISKSGLTGNLSGEFNYDHSVETNTPTASLRLSSELLVLQQQKLQDLKLLANWSNDVLTIEELTTVVPPDINPGGQLKLAGKWNSQSQTFDGKVRLNDLSFGNIELTTITADITTRDNALHVENIRSNATFDEFKLAAKLGLESTFPFQISGDFSDQRLSQWLQQPSISRRVKSTAEITGVVDGKFQINGQLTPWQWRTSGVIAASSLRVNQQSLSDVRAQWNHVGNDWKKSTALVKLLGGQLQLVELNRQSEKIAVEFEQINAQQLGSLIGTPVKITGDLSGTATLNEWSLLATPWAEIKLQGSSLLVGNSQLGDFLASAEYREQRLTYKLGGKLLAGKLTGRGQTELALNQLLATEFPLRLRLRNASLDQFYSRSNRFRALQPLSGNVSANIDLAIKPDQLLGADGRVEIKELKWSNKLITRTASIHLGVSNGQLIFDDVRADLKAGSVFARAAIPLNGKTAGNYELEIRRLDLKRLSEIATDEDLDLSGQLDARIDGKLDSQFTGLGFIGVQQAKIGAVSGESLRLPIQFRFNPQRNSGRIELRRSTFRIFDGRASGKAAIDFGSRLTLDSDLKFSDVDTGKLLAAVADMKQVDQGKLNGRLIINGDGIRETKDLQGSFKGKLQRAPALQWPVLSDLTRFLAGNGLSNQSYDSDEIILNLNRGRIEVKQFNFENSLAKIAITGNAFLDGRLELSVIARVDQLNQPTILDELAGSPLARLSGNPVSFFARAAEFLSNRVVFLHVGGTFKRPQIQLDSGRQIREETIRYFLRGSQILPNQSQPNN